MPQWVLDGYREYEKRLPKTALPKLVELPLAFRGKNKGLQEAKEDECERILTALKRPGRFIALDVQGRAITTEALSGKMADWQMMGDAVNIVIGGPDGFTDTLLKQTDERWSLSGMTLPHPLVRIVLIEQLYRAWTILQNHPYHK